MKKAFRKPHRLITIAVCLPLIVAVATGLGIIFGLAAINPILNGLGLIGLIVTGLSLTGLFDRWSKPKQVIVTALASAVLVTWLSSCSPTAQSPSQSPSPLNQTNVTASQPLDQLKASGKQPNATVEIRNFKYGPASLKIKVGQTIKFVNGDEEAHTVTAKDGSFNSKALDTNEAWMYTFTKAGTFPYFCAIHPFMKGTVTVT